MRYPVLLFAFISFLSVANSQALSKNYLQNYTLVETLTIDMIDSVRASKKVPKTLFPVDYAVKIYEVLYNSKNVDGSTITASGLYFMPVGASYQVPLLSYHHGTLLEKERPIGLWREQNFCVAFATGGYAVAQPDYHGLGKGEGRHLYCHADSEAEAVVNLLRAIQELNELEGHQVSNKLFLTGYSQGGHVTMAAHQRIQEEFSQEFDIVASAPMSGPYDLSGVQAQVMYRPYSHPGYLPYLLYGYQEAHGIFGDQPIFVAPYDTMLPALYTGDYTLAQVNPLLPEIPSLMVHPDIIADYQNNPNSKLGQVLKENDVYDWTPEKPVMFCYCQGDQQVDYKNALVAYNKMKENGAKYLRLRNASRKLNHVPCAYISVVYARLYFDSFYKKLIKGKELPKNGRKGAWGDRVLLDMAKTFTKAEKG